MRRTPAVLLTVALLATPAAAQAPDKAALRELAELPYMQLLVNFSLGPMPRPARSDPETAAAKLAKLLDDGIQGVEQVLDMCEVYHQLKNPQKVEKSRQLAAGMLQQYLQTTDPTEGYFLSLYAQSLTWAASPEWDACDQWARRAVKLSPRDWRCWAQLGAILQQRAGSVLTARYGGAVGDGSGQAAARTAVDRAAALLDEACQCFDRASRIEPASLACQHKRWDVLLTEVLLRNRISALRHEPLPYPFGVIDVKLLERHKTIARAEPGDVSAVPATVLSVLLKHLLKAPHADRDPFDLVEMQFDQVVDENNTNTRVFYPLQTERERAECAAELREFLVALDKACTAMRGTEAPLFCRLAQLLAGATLQDWQRMDQALRNLRAELPPTATATAFAGLHAYALVKQKRTAEGLKLLRDAASSSADAHFVLARFLVEQRRWDLAEAELRNALKRDAANPYCLIGLAAVLLRRSGKANTLDEAGQLLADARPALTPTSSAQLNSAYQFTTALHQALSGEHASAALTLELLRQDYPNDQRITRAIAALRR